MIPRTRVKICGMTNIDEVSHAVEAGVDALGFIFVEKSPRFIEPERAREIVATLPPFVDAVGVFMDEEPERVEEIVQYCGLTMIQLHGAEPPDYCRQFQQRVIKAFQVRPGMSAEDISPYEDAVAGFLLDAFHKDMGGGTGQTFDWSIIQKLQPAKPLILAGGLGVDNVGRAITEVRPFAVDINSAIETEPGRKDMDLITKLFEALPS